MLKGWTLSCKSILGTLSYGAPVQGTAKKFHVVSLLGLAGMGWLSREEGPGLKAMSAMTRGRRGNGTCASYMPFLPLGQMIKKDVVLTKY